MSPISIQRGQKNLPTLQKNAAPICIGAAFLLLRINQW
ncbi:hypothetical protein CPter291_4321 [Collimonas pratensis]|uniref:Uncharacterized protein n=1 Tax=Collimonas pratensis TaxID=279113 RepID=A0ABN4ME85_9BURK|nr:hypothetical protein CPter291_4321 [Collimonas pratensis]